jgi:hypothetical protein
MSNDLLPSIPKSGYKKIVSHGKKKNTIQKLNMKSKKKNLTNGSADKFSLEVS